MRNRTAVPLALLLSTGLAPAAASAEDGARFPRFVEKGDQVCLQNLDAEGRIVESCQDKNPVPASHEVPAVARRSTIAAARFDAAESLSWAAVKYGWSGPLKWAAVTGGTVGAATFAAGAIDDDKSLRQLGGYILLGAGINLAIGLIIDSSAADDVDLARRQLLSR